MEFEEYLKEEEITPEQFAQMSEGAFSTSAVYHWLAGIRNPTDENRKLIYQLSNGKVTRWNGATVTYDS